jgi:trans-2,3-dihydro-3-hydroxyanthranilate isomerase
MTRAAFRYLHLDVFTTTPFEGNQLAVFPDARGLDAATMQAIAREMAFSETTFVLPREDARTDVRMRIFTPGTELPIAGHPTIGSTFALAGEGTIAPGQPRFVFGLGVGPVPVELTWREGELDFASMRQPAPVFGAPLSDVSGIAEGLGVEAADITATGLPVQTVSCGVPFLLVPMATRRAVDAADLNVRALHAHYRRLGLDELPVFFFTTEPGADRASAYSRMFAADFGVVEDPATGIASGPLGCYLLRHGVVTAEQAGDLVSLQGVKMGRPSRIHISVGPDGSAIDRVEVGGRAVLVAEGTLRIERAQPGTWNRSLEP